MSTPIELQEYESFYQRVFADKSLRTWAITTDGNHKPVRHDLILKAYGHPKNKQTSQVFVPPRSESERIVRAYVRSDGVPLIGLVELAEEYNHKIATGDPNNWLSLLDTCRDALTDYHTRLGEYVLPIVEKFNENSLKDSVELQANFAERPLTPQSLALQTLLGE